MRSSVAPEEPAHVVVAHPASNEDDAFVAERSESGTEVDLHLGMETAEQ